MIESHTNLPEDDRHAKGERDSRLAAEVWFESAGGQFIFRPEPPPDRGADAHVEIQKKINGRYFSTGRRAWIQLKHTERDDENADGSISYPIPTRNINYLFGFPCSFYLLHIPRKNELRFAWHYEVVDELRRTRPDWNEQRDVVLRFRRKADAALLQEVYAEIDAVGTQIGRLTAGPGFIRSVSARGARELLRPDDVFVDRPAEREFLTRSSTRGAVIRVSGDIGAGKSELVTQWLCDEAAIGTLNAGLDSPCALVHVDLRGFVEPRLLRGLAWSLGVDTADDIPADASARQQGILFHETLPARTQKQRVLLVLDSIDDRDSSEGDRAQLEALLKTRAVRSGTSVLISRDERATITSSAASLHLRIPALSVPEAVRLADILGISAPFVRDVLESASQLPELLYPGSLRPALELFRARTQSVASADATFLQECLLDAQRQQVHDVLVLADGLSTGTTSPHLTPSSVLLSLAVVYPNSVSRAFGEELSATPLLQILEQLQALGWLVRDPTLIQLTRTGADLFRREIAKRSRAPAGEEALAATRTALVRTLRFLVGNQGWEDHGQLSLGIENGIVWLREAGLRDSPLHAVLLQTFLPLAINDLFFPVSADAASRAESQLASVEEEGALTGALAGVALSLRSTRDPVRFIETFTHSIELASTGALLGALELRVLDIAGYRAHIEFKLRRELLDLRSRLSPYLLARCEDEPRERGFVKWSASWMLNEASLAISAGRTELASARADDAERLINMLTPRTPGERSTQLSVVLRILRVRAQLAERSDDRRLFHQRALEVAYEGLEQTPEPSRWSTLTLNAVQRLAEVVHTDEEREALLHNAEIRLRERMGDWDLWSIGLKARLTGVAYSIAAIGADPTVRLRIVGLYVRRMASEIDETISLGREGYPNPLRVVMRAFTLASDIANDIGDTKLSKDYLGRALELSTIAIQTSPTPDGWELHLSLIEKDDYMRESDWRRQISIGDGSAITKRLRVAMNDAKVWLSNIEEWTTAESQLALYMKVRNWRSEGSLEVWASKSLSPRLDWSRLGNAKKIEFITHVYKERDAEITKLERKAGPFLSLYESRVHLEAQYQRLRAIYGNHVVETGQVLAHLDAAAQIWPDSFAVFQMRARFYSKIWDYENAILTYRRLVYMIWNPAQRRSATVGLIRVLLYAAIHVGSLKLPDGTTLDHSQLVLEALALLDENKYFRQLARDTLLLSDIAALEGGRPVDWPRIEEAYTVVIGGIGAFATTVAAHATNLGRPLQHMPEHMFELVCSRYSDTAVIRSLGTLFLRRAELNRSAEALEDCAKAYACFGACSVLERTWNKQQAEGPTTSFQRARALMLASKVSGSLVPFKTDMEGKEDLLRLASALFSRAVALSVGRFHDTAKRHQSDADKLRKSLKDLCRPAG